MSNEVILNLSFDNQTVTDLTGKWTLDGTPNATYEQIDGRDGYSIVTGSLGRCIVLNAVDQNAVYNEYTVDFDMFVKSTYTSDYYFYDIIYMWSSINPGDEYSGEIGNVLDISLKIGGSEPAGTTNYSPIGRWVHVTFTSGPTEVDNQYRTTAYVDGVKLIDRTEIDVDNNPFALSQQILLLTRDTDAKLMPNGPGICLNTFKVVTGIHMPNQKLAISLLNLSRVFNNFCTWLKRQLSTVAFTGSYNDLSNKPTISTVNDGTLTIQQNGTTVKTFTANASSNVTANITVPTKTSDLTNDSNFITEDTTKIPLSGTNALAGSIVPDTDNSVDIGASSKNIKMLYTKGITISGTQFLPSDYIPRSGGAVISGVELYRTADNSKLIFSGGTTDSNGASIGLYGKNHSSFGGWAVIQPQDGNGYRQMILKPDGTATWGSKNLAMQEDVVPRSGGAVMNGNLFRTADDGTFVIGGGKVYTSGAAIYMRGALDASEPGWMYLSPRMGASTYKNMILKPDGTWTWNGTACQITSDQRYKQQISEIDDKLLDAWEDVDLVQFKYNDAVDQKKDNARLHTGYVVQQIDSACKSHNVDISQYGLYCHEEYPQETEEVEVEQADGTKTKETKVIREASEHYSLRYTEALIVECAYLRKKNKELQEQLDKVIARLDKLENASSK